ncbi:MAG: hypothetical protein R3F56_01810 [Planctomycetota bacterium]
MPEPQAQLVLRTLSLLAEAGGAAQSLEQHHFDSMEIATILAEGGHEPAQFLAVLHALEADGMIRRGHSAGEEGAPFTTFTLTPRGYAAGNPEVHAGGLRPTVRAVSTKASLWVLGALGVTGGPLALAGLVEPAVDWHGTSRWLVDLWWSKVTMPMLDATYRLFDAVGWIPASTLWVENALEYGTFGVLVTAAAWNAARIEREYTFHRLERRPLAWRHRALRFVVLGVLGVLFWPLMLAWELAYTSFVFYAYRFRRDELGPEARLVFSPQALLARAIAYFVPVLAFVALFVVNWVQR